MVKCDLCPLLCSMQEGEIGACKVRGNKDGKVQLLTYGQVTTAIVGPIEQKSIYHFRPGARLLSLGSSGCNMACGYCQNFEISQVGDAKSQIVLPEQVVAMAKAHNAEGVAFTYSEPFVWYEYVSEVAALARKEGLLSVLKTNGYANESYFYRFCELMDAVNVDVKGTAEFYKDVCGIDLPADPWEWVIIRNLGIAKELTHLEVSTIIVEKYMDALPAVFEAMFATAGDIPLHLLKFIPDFKMRDWSPTSDEAMQRAKDMAEGYGFMHVYIDYAGIDAVTKCKCGEELVRRRGIRIANNSLVGNKCPKCGEASSIKTG